MRDKKSNFVLDNVKRIADEAGLVRTTACCDVPSKFCSTDVWRGDLGTYSRMLIKEHHKKPFDDVIPDDVSSPYVQQSEELVGRILSARYGSNKLSIYMETERTVKDVYREFGIGNIENTVRNRNLASVFSKEAMELFFAADRYYNSSDMRYHDLVHANNVVDAAWQISEGVTASLLLAAKWHDAIYVAGGSFNERLSAIALEKEAKKIGLDFDPVTTAWLIEGTVIDNHLDGREYRGTQLGVLLDADLSEMAADYDDFVRNQIALIGEHRIAEGFLPTSCKPANFSTADRGRMDKAAQFLGKFLNKDSIFRTRGGRHLYEAKARENITRFREEWLLK